MYNRTLFTLVILASILFGGCDGTEIEAEVERAVLFDAVELHASRRDDPNQWFLVDISDGIVNYFDESEMDVDFKNFLFNFPTMDAPIPLEVVAPELLVDRLEVWSVRFAETSDDLRFRSGCRWYVSEGKMIATSGAWRTCFPKPPPPIPSF